MSKDESNNDLDLKSLLRKLEENNQKEDEKLKLQKRSKVSKPTPKTGTGYRFDNGHVYLKKN